MCTIATSSQDVLELAGVADGRCVCRRDHDALCDRGWLGEDLSGRPIACTWCRPHLVAHRRPRCHNHPGRPAHDRPDRPRNRRPSQDTCPAIDRRTHDQTDRIQAGAAPSAALHRERNEVAASHHGHRRRCPARESGLVQGRSSARSSRGRRHRATRRRTDCSGGPTRRRDHEGCTRWRADEPARPGCDSRRTRRCPRTCGMGVRGRAARARRRPQPRNQAGNPEPVRSSRHGVWRGLVEPSSMENLAELSTAEQAILHERADDWSRWRDLLPPTRRSVRSRRCS